jgi:CheY-like chemotaxis protein
MTTPSEILVVDDDVTSLAGLLSVLRNMGYRSTGATDIVGGCALLDAFPFDLLITDIRLPAESGLELIRRAREIQPAIAVIAITSFPDAATQHEVERLDAIYMRRPLDIARLKDIVAERVASSRRQRRWNRKPVIGGFGASVAGAAAKIVDVSYGGFRAEMSAPLDPPDSRTIEMNLLPFGLTVNAELVWINRNDPSGTWNCGAALSQLSPTTARAWRAVVDALPESSRA